MTKKTVVVVGGGTAGLTIANNLQEHYRVIVIEKSEYRTYPFIYRIPLLIGLLYRKKALKYLTKKEIVLSNGRHIPFFESRVLGGASVINGCVHTIGSQSAWNDILSNFDSDYGELIERYNKLYTHREGEKYRISLIHAPQNVIDESFIRALNSNNVPVGDMNYADDESCGPIYDTAGRIFRTSVMSLIRKSDFEVSIGETVRRILTDGDATVVGIETNKRTIHSDYVVLAGGVIGTCSLLLGEREGSDSTNPIAAIDVGRGVRDHTNLRVNVITRSEIGSLNEIYRSPWKKWFLMMKHILGRRTLMVGTGATSGAHLDLDDDGQVDARIQVVQFSETGRHGSDGKFFLSKPGFSLSITPIHPASSGTISLSDDGVVIDPEYLADRKDMEILKRSLSYCMKLLRSEPLSSQVLEIVDEHLIETNPERYINENIYSGHHLIGGTQNAIDNNFKVKGLNRLYVCDASIFDAYAASNIHSSVVLMADIFSKRFIRQTSLENQASSGKMELVH